MPYNLEAIFQLFVNEKIKAEIYSDLNIVLLSFSTLIKLIFSKTQFYITRVFHFLSHKNRFSN